MIKPLSDILRQLRLFPGMDPVQRLLILASMPVMLLVFAEYRHRLNLISSLALASDAQRLQAQSMMIEWICIAELAYLLLLFAFGLRGNGLTALWPSSVQTLLRGLHTLSIVWCSVSLVNHALWAGGFISFELAPARFTYLAVLGWILLSATLWSLDTRREDRSCPGSKSGEAVHAS